MWKQHPIRYGIHFIWDKPLYDFNAATAVFAAVATATGSFTLNVCLCKLLGLFFPFFYTPLEAIACGFFSVFEIVNALSLSLVRNVQIGDAGSQLYLRVLLLTFGWRIRQHESRHAMETSKFGSVCVCVLFVIVCGCVFYTGTSQQPERGFLTVNVCMSVDVLYIRLVHGGHHYSSARVCSTRHAHKKHYSITTTTHIATDLPGGPLDIR